MPHVYILVKIIVQALSYLVNITTYNQCKHLTLEYSGSRMLSTGVCFIPGRL